jgi:transcriptional regulator with XRE-family HTH domain
MNIKIKFGNKIKELRKNAEISQEELAYLSGIDRTYISSIEKGDRNVSIAIVEKLSQALKVSIKDFF